MQRVGRVSALLGSISSLLGLTRLFYYITFPFLGEPVPLPSSPLLTTLLASTSSSPELTYSV